jgi:TolB protein
MSIYSKLAVFLSTLLFCASIFAQIRVEVTDGAIAEYNIAVSPVFVQDDSEKQLSSEITESMEMVLNLTGYFNVLNKKSFLEKPQTPVQSIEFKNWLNVGANGLIKGFITKENENIGLDLYFFDVADGKQLLHKKYKVSKATAKKAAHRFINDLVQLLTGEELLFMFSRVAFVERFSDGRYNLVVMDFDGSNREIIYSSKKIVLLPEWSADGKKIYFTSYEKNNPNLYSIDVKSKRVKLVSGHEGLNTSATAHPDNKTIALRLSKDGNAEIYLLDTSSGNLTRMTKNMAIDTAPSFSPDGKEIAFVSNRSGNPHIYRLFVDNPSRVERLTTQGRYNQDPRYSPDGKYIAFTGRDEFFMYDIFLFEISSRVISRVTQNQNKNETPSFSPDSRLLVFSSNRTSKTALFLSNLKGDRQVLVYTGQGEAITPAWSPEVIK